MNKKRISAAAFIFILSGCMASALFKWEIQLTGFSSPTMLVSADENYIYSAANGTVDENPVTVLRQDSADGDSVWEATLAHVENTYVKALVNTQWGNFGNAVLLARTSSDYSSVDIYSENGSALELYEFPGQEMSNIVALEAQSGELLLALSTAHQINFVKLSSDGESTLLSMNTDEKRIPTLVAGDQGWFALWEESDGEYQLRGIDTDGNLFYSQSFQSDYSLSSNRAYQQYLAIHASTPSDYQLWIIDTDTTQIVEVDIDKYFSVHSASSDGIRILRFDADTGAADEVYDFIGNLVSSEPISTITHNFLPDGSYLTASYSTEVNAITGVHTESTFINHYNTDETVLRQWKLPTKQYIPVCISNPPYSCTYLPVKSGYSVSEIQVTQQGQAYLKGSIGSAPDESTQFIGKLKLN